MLDWRKEPMQTRQKYANEYVQAGVKHICDKYGFATPEQVKMVKNDAANIYASTYEEYLELWNSLETLFTL